MSDGQTSASTPPPSSIPAGLTVRLYRGTVRPGESGAVDEWMAMLNDRLDEAVATLDRERMGIEIVFRHRDGDGEHLYWVVVRGDGEHAASSEAPIDLDHVAYDRRCREPTWEVAEPQLLLLPDAVRACVLRHCAVDDDRPPAAGGRAGRRRVTPGG